MSNYNIKKRKQEEDSNYGENPHSIAINISGGENIITLPNDNNYTLNISGGKNNITFLPFNQNKKTNPQEESYDNRENIKESTNESFSRKYIHIIF